MNATKKVSFEKRIVVVLLGVFGLTLVTALKNAGIFPLARPPVSPSSSLASVPQVSQSVPEMMQARWEHLASTPEPQGSEQAPPRPSGSPIYTAGDLRDPFKSLLLIEPRRERQEETVSAASTEVPVSPPPHLAVQGVLWGGSQPQAIINHKVYRVGDTIEGVTILSIGRQGVTVDYQGNSVLYAASDEMQGENPESHQARWR